MQLRTRILLAVVAATMVAPTAAATHMRYYDQVFIEHDDQGRSDEPDFASTGVLGLSVGNCIVDFSIADPGCIPDSALPAPPAGKAAVLAPGCTDDSGRRPSGLCGLWTVGVYHPELNDPSLASPPNTVGVAGMTGSNAPGRFSATKATAIRFMDIQANIHEIFPAMTGSHYIQVNRKLADTGVSAALKSVDPNMGGNMLVGSQGIWAWYGQWNDKNGNGVIDHLSTDSCLDGVQCGADGGVQADNEYVWIGKCIQFNGAGPPLGQRYCKQEDNTRFPVWIWPGNHHAFCGGTAPSPVPAELACHTIGTDLPAHQAICFLDIVSGGATPVFCSGDMSTFDLYDEDVGGDPIFGSQHAVWPDQHMSDRTGDANRGGRQWVYGFGWNAKFYDQSLIVSTIMMGGVTTQPANPESRNKVPYDLRPGAFEVFDVDQYRTVSPVLEDLVQNNLKPASRSNWVIFRDNFVPIQNTTDGLQNQRALDTSATTGPIDDAVIDPGWAREPNTALDRFPVARFRAFAPADPIVADVDEARNGWLNDYAGHRDQWHVFADVQNARMFHTNVAWRHPISGNCLPNLCTTGGGTFYTDQHLSAGANANRQRTIEPGVYAWFGFVGAWRDTVQPVVDEVIDLQALLANPGAGPQAVRNAYVVPQDGWLGNIVNTTGTWKYRGYPGPGDAGAPTCTIGGVSAVRYFAQCNPYYDAVTVEASPYGGPFQDTGVDNEDPNGGPTAGEFVGIFPILPITAQHVIQLFPAGASGDCSTIGTWTIPVIQWKTFANWKIGDTAGLVDYSGRSGAAAVIALQAGIGGGLFSPDFTVFPLGNLGQKVCSKFTTVATVDLPLRGISVVEPITEVDEYVPYAG